MPDVGWDAFGRAVAAIGSLALLTYLLPSVVAVSPAWMRRLEIATYALIGTALVLALGATVVWYGGR